MTTAGWGFGKPKPGSPHFGFSLRTLIFLKGVCGGVLPCRELQGRGVVLRRYPRIAVFHHAHFVLGILQHKMSQPCLGIEPNTGEGGKIWAKGMSNFTGMEETQDRLSPDAFVGEIEGRLQTFERNLPRRIDPIALSRSKLPFKALAYREALIWRVTELGRTALENLHANRLAAAILLVRAVIETTAALWYLSNKLNITLKAGSIGDLDSYLMRLSIGMTMKKS